MVNKSESCEDAKEGEDLLRKIFPRILLVLVLIDASVLTSSIQSIMARGIIYIRADGSIDPPTAPIQRNGNMYAFTGNIFDELVVELNSIVIDGKGYMLEGRGSGNGIKLDRTRNVTIINLTIKSFFNGVWLCDFSNENMIINNTITDNYCGICLSGSSNENMVRGNSIKRNAYGLWLSGSSHNIIFDNLLYDAGLFVFESYKNIVRNNTLNDKPLVYLEDVSFITLRDAGQVVLVNCSNIVVENLILSNMDFSIQLWKTHNTEIIGNSISYSDYGIFLFESSYNNISGNKITNTDYGIYFSGSSNNIMFGNSITDSTYGIFLDGSSYNTLSGNSITDNTCGICLKDSSYNILSRNNITDNYYGIHFSNCSGNIVFHSNFVDNHFQVYPEHARSSINIWDNGYPAGGNHWSDYAGKDIFKGPYQNVTGSDGIGDTPYKIDEYNIDRYPLLASRPADGAPPKTNHDYDRLWHNADFYLWLTATDDVSGISETYYIINNDGIIRRVSVDGQPKITTESANNTLEFWSVDNAGNEEPHNFTNEIKLDKTPPSGWVVINDNEIFTNCSNVELKFNYSDNLSGVAEIRFSNNGLWTNQNWTVPQSTDKNWTLILGEGRRTVYMQIKDVAGNIYDASDSIIVDFTPPRTNHDYDCSWCNHDFYINLTSSDNFSTSFEIYYRINNGTERKVSVARQPYITTQGANNTLEFWSIDDAGNEEIPHQFLDGIKLDKTKPIIVFDLPGKVEVETNMTFDASKSYDVLSGIKSYLWDFGDGTIESGPSVTHMYNKTGTYNFSLTIKDNAENSAKYVKTINVSPKLFPYLLQILGLSGLSLFTAVFIVLVRNKRKKKVKEEPQKGMPEAYMPLPPLEPAVTKKVKLVKPVKSRDEEIDDMVLNYIETHGGTISLSKAVEDLGITYDELIDSIVRLKNAGKIRQE